MKRVLVEGWRGINHSYAMVNQYQLLELVKRPDIALFHRDISFGPTDWNTVKNSSAFPKDMADRIAAVNAPSRKQEFDIVFRIAWPFQRTEENAPRTLTFLTAEYGLGPEHFPASGPNMKRMTAGNAILVTPSSWSKMKLLEFGFPEEKVFVVPHGVSTDIFYPLTTEEKKSVRQSIGLTSEDFVFLNLGAMIYNKGIDILVKAFSVILQRHPHAKLVLKDDKNLYRISGADVVGQILKNNPQLATTQLLNAVKILSITLPVSEMRNLYGMADTYASPYRAEGFNLPIIEAVACGVPVIVTKGGSTDDFCDDRVGAKIPAQRIDNTARGYQAPGYTLEPDLEFLISAMEAATTSPQTGAEDFALGRAEMLERYSWGACVEQLSRLF
jgi:glycosyltransferase involved in cell wall biosynthesis